MSVKTLQRTKAIRNPEQFKQATEQARQNVKASEASKTGPSSKPATDNFVNSKAQGYGVPKPVQTPQQNVDPKAQGYGVPKPVQTPQQDVDPKALGYGVPKQVNDQPVVNSRLSSSYGTLVTEKPKASSNSNGTAVPSGYSDPKSDAKANQSPASNSLGYADTLNNGYERGKTQNGSGVSNSNSNVNSSTTGATSPSQNGKRISEPRHSDPEAVKTLASKQGKTGQDAVKDGTQAQPRELQGQFAQEKTQPGRMGEVDGKQVEIHDKPWQQKPGSERGTQYLNDKQAAEHKVGFKPVENDVNGQKNAALTQNGQVLKNQQHLYVMDKDKEVYSANAKNGANFQHTDAKTGKSADVHHSSFKRGEAVTGAGDFKTREDGTLKKITDGSGHYQPKPENTLQTMSDLEKKGVNLDNTKFEMVRGRQTGEPVEVKGMVNEFRQGGGSETTFKARHDAVDEMNNQKDPKPLSQMSRGAKMFNQARMDAQVTTKKDVKAHKNRLKADPAADYRVDPRQPQATNAPENNNTVSTTTSTKPQPKEILGGYI